MFFPEFSSIKAGNDALFSTPRHITGLCIPRYMANGVAESALDSAFVLENEDEITPKYTEDRVVGLFDPPCFRKMQVDQI